MNMNFILSAFAWTRLDTVLDWGRESPQNPPTRMSALRGAGFPACGFRRLSSRLSLCHPIRDSRTKSTCAILALGLVLGGNALAGPGPLKDAFKKDFLIGAAINYEQIFEEDQRGVPIIKTQFNSITPENVLKWALVHPQPGQFDFAAADRYVQFGESNHMFIVGHTLVWHNQTPAWVFQDDQGRPVSREVLLARMREHIFTVVGRYRGRVQGWDVVNEALNEDGTLRNSPWRKIIGDDFIEKAFAFAHEADPQAELYYNEYSIENDAKRQGAIALIKKLRSKGLLVSAVGIQEHVSLDWPSEQQLDATLGDFEKAGIKNQITELDVDVLPSPSRDHRAEVSRHVTAGSDANPYTNGLPAAIQAKLAERYTALFAIYLKHAANLKRVTFWGVTDGDSWLNDWPANGRTSYPLLFDRAGRPKPAFDAVVSGVQSQRSTHSL